MSRPIDAIRKHKTLYEADHGWDKTTLDALDTAIKALEQPTIEPEPHWIPCSERLPTEGEKVLITDTDGYMEIGRLIRTDEGYKWDVGAWWNDLDDWKAWMPLPEPYRKKVSKCAV